MWEFEKNSSDYHPSMAPPRLLPKKKGKRNPHTMVCVDYWKTHDRATSSEAENAESSHPKNMSTEELKAQLARLQSMRSERKKSRKKKSILEKEGSPPGPEPSGSSLAARTNPARSGTLSPTAIKRIKSGDGEGPSRIEIIEVRNNIKSPQAPCLLYTKPTVIVLTDTDPKEVPADASFPPHEPPKTVTVEATKPQVGMKRKFRESDTILEAAV